MVSRAAAFAVLVFLGSTSPALSETHYFGKEVGRLSQLEHGVRGSVFAVDSRTLYIHRLYYDGEGPSAFFFVGTSKTPSAKGATKLRDERGSTGPLRKYRGESITLSLPEGMTLKDIKWLSIYCDEYAVNFGDVFIPRELEYPRPARLGALSGVHGVSSDPIVVVDAQTLLVPNFSYDGEAPDAKFWVGRGDKPSPQGVRIPDENGKEAPLRRYDKKTIVLTLPGELTVFDIGHFAVWCEAFTVNFGHVVLPRAKLANVPPSLKMLGVSPQSRNEALLAPLPPAPSATTPRTPLRRLKATTYRPARLGAGPLAALLEQPADHDSLLHRRADDYKPSKHQLFQQTKDDQGSIKHQQETKEDQGPIRYQQETNDDQGPIRYQQETNDDQGPIRPGETKNDRQPNPQVVYQDDGDQYEKLQEEYRRNEMQLKYYQELLKQQKQATQERPHQLLQTQQELPQQIYLQQPLYQQQVYQPPYPQTPELLYQQQLYQQQLEAYDRSQIQQQEPIQYRLLPYQNTEHSVGTIVDPIQRSIDLDLVRPGS